MINTEILRQPVHSKSQEDILREYQADAEKGLTPEEAASRLDIVGRNAISHEKKKSLWLTFMSQFNNALVYLLLVAAGLSFFFQEWLDGFAILVVILINAIIGFYMEYQAERSMEALKKLSILPSKVIRNGATTEINAEELVPGDLIFLEAGDMVPADGRIFRPSQLQMDEAALTGESLPVEKNEGQLDEATTLAERTNMLYKGTFIAKGNTRCIVTSTGMLTELGKIASLVQSAEQAATPLEKKLEGFSKKLIKITVALVVIIFFAGLLNGQKFLEMLETSIALAVAAIPEGLPIVATLALAQGMLRMAKHNVIVKKLSAVETLGGTNVICTDKTGTLTQNKIEVNLIVTPSGKYDVGNSKKADTDEPSFQQIVWASILCNTASLGEVGKETGDPLEIGLLKFSQQQGSNIESLRKDNPLVKEEPFSSDTKIMATMHRTKDGLRVYAKGASEELINRCNRIADPSGEHEFNADLKATWLSESEKLAASGLRVIAVGSKTSSADEKNLSADLVFLGLMGMIDPPREEVFAAVQECKSAGIKVIMITGDHPSTAQNIARKLGIMEDDKQAVMNGKDMSDYEHVTEDEKDRWISTPVFARVSPKQKLDLVTVLQDRKKIVGMTGDGVNDAPALKKSDIGIAMGLRGTQVAQEVADMVLKDDSFSSIVLAIRQGRIIFDNIRKFVIFLLSCNMSELFVIAVASVLNLHFQLFPLQILYINIITDVLPALALGVTAGSASIMKQPPRNTEEPIIDKKRWIAMIYYSVIITITTLAAVFISHHTVHKTEGWNPELCNNILFFTLIISQLFHVFNMSSSGSSNFFKNEVFTNRYVWYATVASFVLLFLSYQVIIVRKALDIYPMSYEDWLIAIGMSFTSLVLIQISKTFKMISQ
ncbi:MAG: cation-translocating P-type ATPase [Bacteroidetes bacterium]|jgi:Ca2+-transporting ATPase|nr:cation-translocating P-type ATPase [Bacteroidota bacterium]